MLLVEWFFGWLLYDLAADDRPLIATVGRHNHIADKDLIMFIQSTPIIYKLSYRL